MFSPAKGRVRSSLGTDLGAVAGGLEHLVSGDVASCEEAAPTATKAAMWAASSSPPYVKRHKTGRRARGQFFRVATDC
jgi:hypothetical protein